MNSITKLVNKMVDPLISVLLLLLLVKAILFAFGITTKYEKLTDSNEGTVTRNITISNKDNSLDWSFSVTTDDEK